MKRLLSCYASDFKGMKAKELLEAISRSEGRTVVAETIGLMPPLLGDVTNAELAASFGADILFLNLYDLDEPVIHGLPSEMMGVSPIEAINELTGRPVGINLEPTEVGDEDDPNPFKMTKGRIASAENAKKARDQGASFLVITGNPETGVNNQGITRALKEIREAVGDDLLLIAGKMHGSGVLSEQGQSIVSVQDVEEFVAAGADIMLLPAPGSIPGVTLETVRELVLASHNLGALVLIAIGTSQEGADAQTIRNIALLCKQAGADLHHLGDSGYLGIALPENIMAYSIAIRGVRHTYHRMAASIKR